MAAECKDKQNVLSILSLPAEIIELILKQNCIQHVDIGSCSIVCKDLHRICNSNELWKKKVCNRYTFLEKKLEKLDDCDFWKKVYINQVLAARTVLSKICDVSPKHHLFDDVSTEYINKNFTPVVHSYGTLAVIEELKCIIHAKGEECNLTHKYYTEKVLKIIQQQHLSKKWKKFFELPVSQQQLEKGALWIAQWFQPTLGVTKDDLHDVFDNTAKHVEAIIQKENRFHPCLNSGTIKWKGLSESKWPPVECRQVLECINKYLFTDEGLSLSGNTDNYYDPNNSFINKVLETKQGIPITLCIIYSSVAQRLGVFCEPINAPSHFLLRFLENPGLPGVEQYTHIDAFNGGKIGRYSTSTPSGEPVPAGLEAMFHQVAQPIQVFVRMLKNLINIGRQQQHTGAGNSIDLLRSSLELYTLLNPNDIPMILLLMRVLNHLGVHMDQVYNLHDQICEKVGEQFQPQLTDIIADGVATDQCRKDDLYFFKPKRRPENCEVTFSVGMIMKHRRYDYYCVIYGWDAKCRAGQQWMLQMGVNDLPHKGDQPFYNVLVEDGSKRYAAQENLYQEEPKEIPHPLVGKYFEKYAGTHYVTNAETVKSYPDDVPFPEPMEN